VFHEVVSDEPTVEEMEHRFFFVHEMDKVKVAAAIAAGVDRTLMFCNTKRAADRTVSKLQREGVRAAAIHGDLSQGAREKALADFMAGKVPVLVATDVAARGIHVDGVDVVVHYEPADDDKTYIHRSGRTARAGETGVAVTLMLWNQENAIRVVQRRLGLQLPIVEVFSNDPRLADIKSWDPAAEESVSA
jgi:superfamily II DNA/RNA helicase